MANKQIIVVGGGLSGLSAAHTILERGGRVLLLDKNSFLGGNSTKATSGINGALTTTQIKLGIPDSAETFYEDTARSARDLLRPELVKVLTHNSASAVKWLQDKFELDLSLVSRLGGHSFPRTHRGKEKFPGMTITYALMEKLEDFARTDPNKVKILKKARVTRLIFENGYVVGVEYEMGGKIFREEGPVILATGGYAADFNEGGLIQQYRPDLFNLPTTNGDHSTGDGIKMVREIGGNTIDLEKVQVHPTGLVDPNEPNAKVKFLAAEALRGVGGILLNREGKRFCDELGHRDYVTGEMWKSLGPFRLVLNQAASKEIEWHCKHYIGRNLMKKFPNGQALAAEMGIPVSVLEETFRLYNEAASTKKDPFGKKFFHNLPFSIDDEFHVSFVTPVVHYTMGGLEITPEGQILSPSGPIKGLFAAGELCGGVHGANRLGGSSLLGCVVFGRVAGETASCYLLDKLIDLEQSGSATRRVTGIAQQLGAPKIEVTDNELKLGATITQPTVQTKVEVEPSQKRITMEIVWNGQNLGSVGTTTKSQLISHSTTPVRTVAPSQNTTYVESKVTPQASSEGSVQKTDGDRNREYTIEEVAKHNTEKDCWVIVNDQVLDVTNFLPDHPGGKKAILIYAGRDATAEFNMLHKPDVIEKYAPECVIGRIKGSSGGNTSHQSSASKDKVQLIPSNTESRISGGTADILPKERAKATFNPEKLTNILDGGVEGTKRRRFIMSPGERVETPKDKYALDAHGHLREHVRHFMKIHETYWDTFKPTREDILWMSENATMQGSLMNHYGLFLPTIEVHASDEQHKWWSNQARTMKIVGCYAQTELGHGSNVRGLTTIAEYDKNTKEFVLNTPTLKSMKWWPGTLGKIATHALVYAQLIIDGKEYGVHSFMLQIRDENHKPLPGIELGDLGPKLGDHANDTGYMKLDNVRIPREFMLARYQQVTPDGQYVKSESKNKNSKLHYTTMIFTRAAMAKTAGSYLARAVTIAVRYSCVRTQGFIDTKKGMTYQSPERQVIDYQVQRYRVFKQLSIAYAIKFTGLWMLNKMKDVSSGNNRLANVEALPETAATSGGLKGLCTFLAWQGIEDCRKACGGNGYLMASGLAPLAANYVWQTTAEGDWILLMLQTAAFLLKSINNSMKGKPLAEVVAYLAPLQGGFNLSQAKLPESSSPEAFLDLDFLTNLFRQTALITVGNVGLLFQQRLGEKDGRFDEAFNACALELVTAVRAHCFAFMLSNFVKIIKDIDDKAIKDVLSKLCALFAFTNILDDPQWNGLITTPQLQMVKLALVDVMEAIRPNAVALVDAFDIPDRVLGSAIGHYDGNVYEALYQSALDSPLNQRDPFDGYQEYLRPYLDLDLLKRGNKVPSKM